MLEQFSPLASTVAALSAFIYLYPVMMAYIWMTGALYYFFKWEYKEADKKAPPPLESYPMVSIIVPCYNESENVEEVIEHLDRINYPNYEIIAINDGSRDDTAEKLIALLDRYEKLRVVDFILNQGKATGLNMGAMAAKGEYLVCIDGDSLLDPDSVSWMVRLFLKNPRLGAITGNPKVRNRSTVLGRLQVGEFSAIIGLIKRAQRIYGKIFAVSGVVTAFRKCAVHDVGYWSTDMITEDIDMCWRLQIRHWDVIFEPNALCWILMPETISGLWKQRLRWAQGGVEVLFRYWKIFLHTEQKRMWPIFFEYMISILWSFSLLIVAIMSVLLAVGEFPVWYESGSIYAVALGVTFILQFLVSFYISSHKESGLFKNLFWMIWYPLAYWIIIAATSVVGTIKAISRKKGKRAVWESPDRGIK